MSENTTKIRKIGILTSGGDAPGMNAAVRAVTRYALRRGIGLWVSMKATRPYRRKNL